MAIGVATINDLRGINPGAKALRFVEEKKCLYWFDPVGAGTHDNDLIVSPLIGTGRWCKQFAANEQNSLLWEVRNQNANFAASINAGYILDFSGFTANITMLLPVNPPIGSTVRLHYVSPSSIQKQLIINPNGALINGASGSFAIFQQHARAELVFMGSQGWSYFGNSQAVLIPTGTLTNFPKPASTNLSQNGLINFMGRRFNLANNYVNPANAPLLNNFYLFLASGTGVSTANGRINMISRANNNATLTNPAASVAPGPSGLLILPMNINNFNLQYPMRITDWYYEGATTQDTFNIANVAGSLGVENIIVSGTRDIVESSDVNSLKPSWLYNNRIANGNFHVPDTISGANWERIATIPTLGLTASTGWLGAVASAYHVPVNGNNFYTAIHISFQYGAVYNSNFDIQEIELFGDIIT